MRTRIVDFSGPSLLLGASIGALACDGGSQRGRQATSPALPDACAELAATFAHPATLIDAAAPVAAGELSVGGNPVAAHCLVSGRLGRRTGSDGNEYAIGFEMRLPDQWNGRFYHQGNGGLDGFVVPATGSYASDGQLTSALLQGFAVISSDAGHSAAQNATFGLEPQARLDFGYRAAEKLTPMAKSLIEAAYGRGPDRSYFGGCSNGGRHTMVAMARLAQQYDGFVAGAPGFNLPRAAVAQVWGAQQYAALATPGAMTRAPPELGGFPLLDLATAISDEERQLVSAAIVRRCDELDGAADAMVADVAACQQAFDLQRDVPTCAGERDATCLTAEQKSLLARIFAGARTTGGEPIYSSFPFDPGIANADWAAWEFVIGQSLDPLASGVVFSVPPVQQTFQSANVDELAAAIYATNAVFTESAMSFMTPPNATDLSALRQKGAKAIVFHGTADAVFSYEDTRRWYEAVAVDSGGDARDFVRLFAVPGMGHCGGGMATDQFDLLTPLVAWVEQGAAPRAVVASARGPGNPGGQNPELPASWSATRTRPLCPHPEVARYRGEGSLEEAASFACE